MNLLKRFKEPTPPFFRRLRNIGITLATVGGTIIAAPIELSELLVNIASYLTVAGTVAVTVSQSVVQDGDAPNVDDDESLYDGL